MGTYVRCVRMYGNIEEAADAEQRFSMSKFSAIWTPVTVRAIA